MISRKGQAAPQCQIDWSLLSTWVLGVSRSICAPQADSIGSHKTGRLLFPQSDSLLLGETCLLHRLGAGLSDCLNCFSIRFYHLDENNLKCLHSFINSEHLDPNQCGITCGAIDEPSRSWKANDKRVIINFRDKYVVLGHFCDKKKVFYFYDKMSWFVMICHYVP